MRMICLCRGKTGETLRTHLTAPFQKCTGDYGGACYSQNRFPSGDDNSLVDEELPDPRECQQLKRLQHRKLQRDHGCSVSDTSINKEGWGPRQS